MRITQSWQAAACGFVAAVCAMVTPAMGADPAPKGKVMTEFRGQSAAPAAAPLSLWYRAPAAQWVEALPIGNGRLGAMVFGGVSSERMALNESTLWSGTPVGRAAPEAAHLMPQIRAAVLAKDFAKAGELVRKQQGPWTEAYMPLGDLLLEFASAPKVVDEYQRSLDLDRAVQTTRFAADGAVYTREVFASGADQVIVVRLTCDQPGKLSFRSQLDTQLKFKKLRAHGEDTLIMTGKAPLNAMPSYRGGKLTYADEEKGEGMNFEVRLRALPRGGRTSVDESGLRIGGADAVTLILSAATSYNGPQRSPGLDGKDPSIQAARDVDEAAKQSYESLLQRHLADYKARFGRVSLDLGPATTADMPTDHRVAHWRKTRDPQLAALLFQYGRYLLISSSRDGGTAANLQGMWNENTAPPWSSNYTTNINAEMNYWPAETTNLADSHTALLALIRAAAAPSGAQTARRAYGARGWLVHHNSDIWGASWAVGAGDGSPEWANWPLGGAWLAAHLWEHHAFDPADDTYLRDTAYPLMKGAAEFCLDLLVDDGHGKLATIPSTSPETDFVTPEGKKHAVTAGATMDMALIRELFKHTIAAAETLKVDADFVRELRAAREKLVPYRISSDGTLAEWADPAFKAVDPRHRHVSHVIGLYPLADITHEQPELINAAKRTLAERGDESTGWSLAWKLNLWARLHDGEHAHGLLDYILRPVGFAGESGRHGGVYLNLFGAHPPFQIDGNFGYTAGVAEMLLQSHAGEIHLLPALPTAWPTGSVRGLRARGGYEVDIEWKGGQLVRAELRPTRAGRCVVRYGRETRELDVRPGTAAVMGPDLR